MPKGTEIIVSSPPRGLFREGALSGTPRPGTILEIDPDATSEMGGVTSGTNEWTYQVFSGSSGVRPLGPLFILLPDYALSTWDTNATGVSDPAKWYSAFATGAHVSVYTPCPGEEFNLIIGDQSGTGDDHVVGAQLMVENATGKLMAVSSEECSPFMLLETLTDPATTDNLAWVIYSGY